MKQAIGWLMLLLGVIVLTGAIADSKVGGWLRAPNPPAVTAPLTGIGRVSVRADKMSVQIAGEDRPDVAVTVHGTHSGWVKPELIRSGDELEVRVEGPWWHRADSLETISVEIRLPETLKALDVRMRTGKVTLSELRVDQLSYDGQTGFLSAGGVQVGEADLQLVTGKIDLAHFAGAVRVRLTTGSFGAQFDALSGPVTVDQVTGQLELKLPAGAGATLTASAGRGAVRSDLPLEGSGSSLHGTIGTGTYPVDLHVGTGEITIR
jgi:lia operon protein LiaG